MLFFIVDDDRAVRQMLEDIIEDEQLGTVIGTADDGDRIDSGLMDVKAVDILLIDLLMPVRDGIETVRSLGTAFAGKFIMISQVESKEMIAEAYALGVEYYVTKPINRLEVVSVIRKVIERLRMERSLDNIRNSLKGLTTDIEPAAAVRTNSATRIRERGRVHLSQLGMIGEPGSLDLLDMLQVLVDMEQENPFENEFPLLKEILEHSAMKKLGTTADRQAIQKEVKATEQRTRRALSQALVHLASLGLTDYNNPVFETYATQFFDFSQVRKIMLELEKQGTPSSSSYRLNIKKFLQVLFYESKQNISQ